MSKSKKRSPQTPNNGRNRAEKREQARRPSQKTSGRPLWLRVLILTMMFVMVIGFFLLPLLR